MARSQWLCVLLQIAVTVSICCVWGRPADPPILREAIRVINDRLEDSAFFFKLLRVDSQEATQAGESIRFVIKESACRKPAGGASECPFRERGATWVCAVAAPAAEEANVTVTCQALDAQDGNTPGRQRRAHLFNISRIRFGSSLLDSGNKNVIKAHAASCLSCLFEELNKSVGRR